MSYLDRIRACNNAVLDTFLPLRIGGGRLGWIGRPFADILAEWPRLFVRAGDGIDLDPALTTAEAGTTLNSCAAMADEPTRFAPPRSRPMSRSSPKRR